MLPWAGGWAGTPRSPCPLPITFTYSPWVGRVGCGRWGAVWVGVAAVGCWRGACLRVACVVAPPRVVLFWAFGVSFGPRPRVRFRAVWACSSSAWVGSPPLSFADAPCSVLTSFPFRRPFLPCQLPLSVARRPRIRTPCLPLACALVPCTHGLPSLSCLRMCPRSATGHRIGEPGRAGT